MARTIHFEADNPQTVRDENEVAGIPFTRIFKAVDIPLSLKKKSIKRSFYILAGGIGIAWVICMIVQVFYAFWI